MRVSPELPTLIGFRKAIMSAVLAACTAGTGVWAFDPPLIAEGNDAIVAEDVGLPAKPPSPKDTTGLPANLQVRSVPVNANGPVDWCQTQHRWKAKAGNLQGVAAGCATQGTCDTPSVRDSWIPSGATPFRTMHIKFNVFANSDGTSPAATQAGVDAQMVQLNADFAPSRIQWVATTQFINNTTYRQFADSEEAAMKAAYADAPATQLNVYVVNIQAGYLGVGTFPWDPDSLGTYGGLIIDDNWFGSGQKTLTHEVGHCVGLWHTHHGVSEVTACSLCWERADGFEGDITGDFAADTAPTPTNYTCSPPGGTDSCSGTAWGATDPQNYMGYAPDSCYTEFSPQQWGREHCWSNDVLTGWLDAPCSTNPECDDGLFCNGSETCVATACQPGADPCPGQGCDEVTNTCVAPPSLVYEWNMNTNPGWTVQGQWAWGVPTGGGGLYGGPDPTSGATGSSVYGYNLAGDYANNLAETHLTSTAIDCTGLTSVTLRFQRWLGVEVNTYDHAYVRVSNNGSTWTTIWSNGAEIADTAWSLQEFDISAVADNQATVYLRWTMGTTDSSWQFCGWNIDDVQILAIGGGGGCTVNAECDDGLYCNGWETCVNNVCQAGTAPNCADAVACTTDSCNEATDSCDHTPNNAACNDGLACNGAETCNATLGCQSGTAVTCDDGVACTTDACTEPGGTCGYTPNNAACGDGVFCNGTEVCNATLGCQAGSDPCPGLTCDEINDVCIGGAEVWMSFIAATTVPSGVGSVQNEDIVARNVITGAWRLVFDGSDVGLSGFVIDAMTRLSDGTILLSFTASGTVAGMTGGPGGSTTLDDSDIVRFIPTLLGATTAGSFVFYFDGSDVGLTTNDEDVDAVGLSSSGQLVVSTLGAVSATGASGADTDLLLFTATSLGSVTAGSFSVYFDGSDVSLTDGGSEDVDAVSIMPDGKLLLSTIGAVSVPGVSGANEDVLQFTPTTLGSTTSGTYAMYLDLSTLGISTGADVGAVDYVAAP